MRYVRHVEDGYGNLVEILYYCCRLCYVEEPEAELAELPGGWWPCLDSELDAAEACRVCGEPIGPASSQASGEPGSGSPSHLVRPRSVSAPPVRMPVDG